jgi:hypothetical protein
MYDSEGNRVDQSSVSVSASKADNRTSRLAVCTVDQRMPVPRLVPRADRDSMPPEIELVGYPEGTTTSPTAAATVSMD